jgi:UDP-N-acetylmuramoylalanine--D-glutamate ligase
MKIAILGFAKEGQAAYDYWNRDGNGITICDQNAAVETPSGAQTQLGIDYLNNLDRFDLLVRTPALHPSDISTANIESPDILSKVTSITNEFFRVSSTKNIVGVTGTKGKGTTSTLIAKILEAAGKRVHLGGNIGTPLLELLKNSIKADDWVVMELSSFQLIDLKHSPHIAVCLMVVPEHMDWHEDRDEYISAKQQLFMNQTGTDIAIYYSKNENSEAVSDASQGIQVPYMAAPGAEVVDGKITIESQQICDVSELKLLGKHNWQNACAAITAVWSAMMGEVESQVLIEATRSVLTSFSGLEHRLEFVRELAGVKYYNDSFGTTPETAIVAIEAFEQPKVVILGGSDKGADFSVLARTVANNTIRQVILIGNTSHPHYKTVTPKIEAALRAQGVDTLLSTVKPGGITMNEIVQVARDAAQPGDVVLLSTACASFDLFKNYKERGEQFKQSVLALS